MQLDLREAIGPYKTLLLPSEGRQLDGFSGFGCRKTFGKGLKPRLRWALP
jgi:hypothetical protein